MKQQFIVDATGTFKQYIYADNRKIIPTTATLNVYKPGTSDKLIDAVAMTIAGDGLLSYALTTAHNDIADDNYKAVITYTYNSISYTATVFYNVVNSILRPVITDDDIINELPQLRDNGLKIHGVATSGSTTTIVDINLKRYPDDYFTGGLGYSVTRDETREITDFVSSTGTVTTTSFTGAIATDKYILTRSFTREIQRAFEKLESMLEQAGRRSHLVLDSYDLRETHIMMSAAEICKGMISTGGDGMWPYFYEAYDKRGYAIFKNLNLKYDDSIDGYISGAEESRRIRRTIGRA